MIMASKVPNQCWQFIACVVACDAPRGLPKNSSRRTRWHHVEVWEWGPSSMIRVICSTSMHHVVLYSIFVHRIISDASWKLVFVAKWWLSHDARRITKKREKSHHAHRDRAVVERRPGEIPVFERNSGFWSVLASRRVFVLVVIGDLQWRMPHHLNAVWLTSWPGSMKRRVACGWATLKTI